MNECILILGMGLISAMTVNSQTTDPVVNALLAINESQFIGKPLDSFIAVLPLDISG